MKNIKFKNFSQIEKVWLESMLSVDFLGKEIILKQLDNAQISRDYNVGFISLKFNVDKSIQQFIYRGRVPIEMRVTGKNEIPIVFLLHVIDGFVDELEIFNADSSPISNYIQIQKKDVIVDEILKSGDTRGLNEHPLTGNRKGQWAIDSKETGRGRGAGRVIFEKNNDESIDIIEFLLNHDY